LAAPRDADVGSAAPSPVLDVHTHAFPDRLAASAIAKLRAGARWYEVRPSYDGTVGGLVASMDRAGIRKAVLCSIATRPEQVRNITDWSASIAGPRIVPFASIHPDYPEPEQEARRIAAAGLRGLKFHPYYMNCPADDPRAVRVARAAADAHLAMVFHSGYDMGFERDDTAAPAHLRRLHEQVPDLRMVAAHMGGWLRWPEALRDLAGLPIWLETSYTIGQCPEEVLRRLLDAHPPDRLLFGTDAPWADQKAEVERFRALPIGEGLKRRILWENGRRWLGLEAEPG
jgi:predicted TIM-barrel fold metal-dependent hydrolase